MPSATDEIQSAAEVLQEFSRSNVSFKQQYFLQQWKIVSVQKFSIFFLVAKMNYIVPFVVAILMSFRGGFCAEISVQEMFDDLSKKLEDSNKRITELLRHTMQLELFVAEKSRSSGNIPQHFSLLWNYDTCLTRVSALMKCGLVQLSSFYRARWDWFLTDLC